MNIVRGVADLIRRSSGGQSSGDGGSWGHGGKSAPYPSVRFRNIGEEAELSTLWSRYENTIDKAEKRKMLQVFLLHFIQTFKNWNPVHSEGSIAQEPLVSEGFFLGCSFGHPSELILILIQEVARVTSLVTELNDSPLIIDVESSQLSYWTFPEEEIYVLNCLMITTRSKHNCKVFGYYGGVQKITALMKAAVIKLKTLTSAFVVNDEISSCGIERFRSLHKILVYVVSIISGFISYNSVVTNSECVDVAEIFFAVDDVLEISSRSLKSSVPESLLQLQQKAIVLVMEAGGVNWLVELLRVMRRLNLKEQWTDLSLQYLTLGTLGLTLSENPRAQAHFRSIGGLEVLLDGLGLPLSKYSALTNTSSCGERTINHIFGILKLQILSLEVLRDSSFGNISNLQYLCENGRIDKLANSICWPAFMFQDFLRLSMDLFVPPVSGIMDSQSSQNSPEKLVSIESSFSNCSANSSLSKWKDYAIKLSTGLCSFLLSVEDSQNHNEAISSPNSFSISILYSELSIRWFLKVLVAVFPCLKACSCDGISNHTRILANTLQRYILRTFRKLLIFSPSLLEVFRQEGIWELIFSEKFFYFGPLMLDTVVGTNINSELKINPVRIPQFEACIDLEKFNEVDLVQVEAISFLEFFACLRGNTNNMTECSVLLDTLEKCACNSGVACILLKSLHRVLQLAVEQSVASFKSLDAIARILKVACIQAQELKKLNHHLCSDEPNIHLKCSSCLNSSMELFEEYILLSDDARSSILHSSSCIEYLFDLFWEESLSKVVMKHIRGLLKVIGTSAEDHASKLLVCSKYLETFTRAKERVVHFEELSIELLSTLREILTIDLMNFQKLFRDGECFLHLISLLNGSSKEKEGENLVLNVLQTLTLLLSGNDESKVTLRELVGPGYHTLKKLLLDFYKGQPTEGLLNAVLDMLVDGNFDINEGILIKNEDVILLLVNVLQKSSASLQHYVLNVLLILLKNSIANRTLCSRAGVLSFLLDWFSEEKNVDMISKVTGLIQIIGGHSISGKDLRKIFAILRSENIGCRRERSSLLLGSIRHMLKEKGPEAFFELTGYDSGIRINTPLQWPNNKGFSFTCWVRIEDFPENRMMGLFSFLTDNGKGCSAILGKDKLVFESMNQKRQCISLPINLLPRRWHFLSITHSIGRAFSSGSLLRCYLDGNLISSEKFRYAKVSDALTCCEIGTEITLNGTEGLPSLEKSCPFLGQIGPVYVFNDSLSSEQVKGVYQLGPSYMYLFFSEEASVSSDSFLHNAVLDGKDGLSSKILFGLNAQASSGRTLSNVSSLLGISHDEHVIEATVMKGTQLCTRRLLQDIINCVGGISVFFPLLIQHDRVEENNGGNGSISIDFDIAAQVIELIASVLDENLANQQQMHHLSGFSILGFFLQSVSPMELNTKTVTSLKYLFDVLKNCSLSELLLKEAILHVYLNPRIWLYANYVVQRDIIMYLIQYFETDKSLLPVLFGLPWIIDMVHKFYWEVPDNKYVLGIKQNLDVTSGHLNGENPGKDEIHKIRLLLLSLGELSLRQKVSASDIKTLIAFFEKAEDVQCAADVLHMIIRALSQKSLLASFLEQLNIFGGCQMFINLLQRDLEPIRLLGLQLLGKLLVGLPSEKKEPRFFSISVGRSKPLSENYKKDGTRYQPIFDAMSDRLFKFPLSDHLCAALFDVLLGGASPKQVLQRHSQSEKQKNIKNSSTPGSLCHFYVPQVLVCIFKVLASISDKSAREKILSDLLDLLYSNPSNIEALMEYAWNPWLATSLKLLKDHEKELKVGAGCSNLNYPTLIRNLFCIVLSHYICFVKGGWRQLEETMNSLLLMFEKEELAYSNLLRYIFEDVVGCLLEISLEENLFASQPCRDNSSYLLKLIDEMIIGMMGGTSMFSGACISSIVSENCLQPEYQKYISLAVNAILNADSCDGPPRNPWNILSSPQPQDVNTIDDEFWIFYDKLWILITEVDGKGTNKIVAKCSTLGLPSFGQRARGLVESWNIPAAEMAAGVVSGGLSNALGGKTNKYVEKTLLRGEKCPRIVFHLLVLYLQRATLERASKCVQQFVSLIPYFMTFDDEHSKNRLHFFIWFLLTMRSLYGVRDDGARLHIITHLVLEVANCCKSLLATSILGKDDTYDAGSNVKEAGFIINLIQRDRVLAAATEEVKYIKSAEVERVKQLQELHAKLEECSHDELHQKKLFEEDIQSTMNIILSSDDMRRSAFQLAHDEELQIVAEKGVHMYRALIDERGSWSAHPFPNNIPTHWKLDKTEDSWRRRPKLKRNYNFNVRLCHPPSINLTCDISCPKAVSCTGTGSVPEKMKLLLKGVRGISEDAGLELNDSSDDSVGLKDSGFSIPKANQSSKHLKELTDQVDTVRERKSISSSGVENESNEVQLSIPCVLITAKRKLAGQLTIVQYALHFSTEFGVEGTGGSSVFSKFAELRIPETSKCSEKIEGAKKERLQKGSSDTDECTALLNGQGKIKRHRRWNISKIKAVHLTRYLLQYTAIEMFFIDSVAPVFLNFASQTDAKHVGTLIVSMRNESLFPKGSPKDKNGIIYFVDRRVAVEIAETSRERWRRREISNFEYLMILNTLSGRTYNDLTQYPVFPWVLTDYSSEKLDFNKSSTFRDLSKPVGALDSKRFQVFEDRFRNFNDPDIPNFYYGSHYSSMGIVLFYLLRLEPYTTLHRSLQGGKFDHADRLFQSIEGTFRNCLSNTSDVKELIPEFFYMPEFLMNSNFYHLGVKQDGEPLADVALPPWAKGSPEEFIYRHREALESEYVSSNLHHWIDLVFGYKQRGMPAVEAGNVFYYLTYEGAVDLEAMDDLLQRSAIEDQISNFGQTPIQIFRKKHPRRGPPVPIAHPLYFVPASITLTSTIISTANPSGAVLFVGLIDSNIVVVNQGLTLSVKLWLTAQLQSGGNFTFSGSQDPSFGIGSDILTTRKIRASLPENIELEGQCFATLQTAHENFLILCGSWGNSFQVISLSDGRIVQSIRQHKDVVSCVAVASDGSIIATGSYDTTIMLWHAFRGKYLDRKPRSAQVDFSRKDQVIVENPFHILCGHDDIITCLSINAELDVVISGSKDGTCIFHTLRDGRYVRSIRHPSGCALSKLVASQHGRLVFYSDGDLGLHLFNINGQLIASSESNGRLSCIELSRCGDFLVCAIDHGQIVLRSMHSLDIIRKYEGAGKVITSLAVTPEECFLVGTKDGSILVYSIESLQNRKASFPKNGKPKTSSAG